MHNVADILLHVWKQQIGVGSCSVGTVRANETVAHMYRKIRGLLSNQYCSCYRLAQVVDVRNEAATDVLEVR